MLNAIAYPPPRFSGEFDFKQTRDVRAIEAFDQLPPGSGSYGNNLVTLAGTNNDATYAKALKQLGVDTSKVIYKDEPASQAMTVAVFLGDA